MSNQRHPDKVKVNAWVTRQAEAKLSKLAKLTGRSKSDELFAALTIATRRISLTDAEMEQITRDTAKARRNGHLKKSKAL